MPGESSGEAMWLVAGGMYQEVAHASRPEGAPASPHAYTLTARLVRPATFLGSIGQYAMVPVALSLHVASASSGPGAEDIELCRAVLNETGFRQRAYVYAGGELTMDLEVDCSVPPGLVGGTRPLSVRIEKAAGVPSSSTAGQRSVTIVDHVSLCAALPPCAMVFPKPTHCRCPAQETCCNTTSCAPPDYGGELPADAGSTTTTRGPRAATLCRDHLYSLQADGACVPECSAPLVSFGNRFSGRACMLVGEVCTLEQGCRPLDDDCVRSRVTADGEECLACSQATSWLVGGQCLRKVLCENSNVPGEGMRVRELSGVVCNCNKPKLPGGRPGDRSCMRCILRKVRQGGVGEWYHQKVYKTCERCKDFRLFDGTVQGCIDVDACPADKAIYRHNPNGYRGTCEAPFRCIDRKKQLGGHAGLTCKCSGAIKYCKDCTFAAGYNPVCLRCKRDKYYSRSSNSCLTPAQCSADGGMPAQGLDFTAGGTCEQ